MVNPKRQLFGTENALNELRHFISKIPFNSPQQIYARIRGKDYIGQERAVKAASLWAYRHLSRLRKIYLKGINRELLPPKTNMLFVGPTGCGKTYLIDILFQEILKLPTVIVDMTGFSETGYVGQDVSSILTRLFYAAELNPVLAACGVICLDEFDKLASGQNNAVFAGAGTTKDVSGLGVQRELLKMLEKAEIPFPLELSHSDYAPKATISTQDIVYAACGTFSGLKGLIETSNSEHIGFGRTPFSGNRDKIAVSYTEEDVDLVRNFRNYGFLPELIGRFSRVLPFQALSSEQLKSIMKERVLKQYQNEFLLDGITLVVQEEVLDMIVSRSLKRETGARGIDASFNQHLEDAAFETYSRPGVKRVVLNLKNGKVVFGIS